MDDNDRDQMHDPLMLNNASELMDRQSVRATFRLSAEFIQALSILSTHFGIKQKSLFDYLLEDTESLLSLARLKRPPPVERKNRIQKTFVISRKSLMSLDALSKELAVSRDDMVEYAIQRLLPILLKEREQQKHREDALFKIKARFGQSAEFLSEIEHMVGKEDPVYTFLEAVVGSYRNAFTDMEDVIEKGKKITKLSLEKFRR
jgi:hypothetical protein